MTASASGRILGTANILVGVVMAGGGFLEAAAQARVGERLSLIVGMAVVGGGAGVLFLASGAALWTGWRSARRLTFGAAVLALVVHGAALGLASPGVPVLLVGVVYPVGVLLRLWSRPGFGSGQPVAESADSPGGDVRSHGHRLRLVVA